MKYLLIGLIKLWRLVVSPLYGNVCRYYPSCSAYALGAVRQHGAARGSWLALRRLLRCHPWAPGGYDPVPGTEEPEEPGDDPHRAPDPAGEDGGEIRAADVGAGPRVDRMMGEASGRTPVDRVRAA